MKHKKYISEYLDWEIHFVEIEKDKDWKKLKKLSYEISDEGFMDKDIINQIREGYTNGGWHLYKNGQRVSMILLYKQTDPKLRHAIINHEKRHLEDNIIDYSMIECSEGKAMLSGYVSKIFYEFL